MERAVVRHPDRSDQTPVESVSRMSHPTRPVTRRPKRPYRPTTMEVASRLSAPILIEGEGGGFLACSVTFGGNPAGCRAHGLAERLRPPASANVVRNPVWEWGCKRGMTFVSSIITSCNICNLRNVIRIQKLNVHRGPGSRSEPAPRAPARWRSGGRSPRRPRPPPCGYSSTERSG